MTRPSRSHTLLLALLAAGLVGAGAAAAAPARYAGRPLADALRALQRGGLTIVFTTRLVRPEMTVAAEPVASAPRQVLDEILAPHGLETREGPPGVLVVVARADGGAPAAAATEDAEADAEAAARQLLLRDEIVVRPSRLALLQEQTDSSFALGREEIERLSHLGGDVFRATSLLPGVAANDVTAQFSVHGGRRDEVRVVLDGQELYDAYHLKDFDNALSVVAARALAGATLTTGAYPASQGDRMSGVLDLRTVDPPTGRQYVLGLSVLDALASSAGRFASDRGAWLATARRGSLDLAGEVIGDGSPRFWDALGKAELQTGGGLVAAHVLAAGDALEVDKVSGADFERFANRYRSRYAWLVHQATPGGRLLVETLASWAQVERRRGGAGGDEEGGFTLRDRRELEVQGLAQSWSRQLAPRHLLAWGGEARRYDAFFDYARDRDPEFVILSPFLPAPPLAHDFRGTLRGEHLALWVSDRLALRDRLTAELGLRFDRHGAPREDLVSPRLSLAWRQGERGVLRAAWGRFFQSQRPYELQVDGGEETLRPAELSQHWVVGYEALLQPGARGVGSLRLELFRREIAHPRPRFESLLEPLNYFPEIEPDRVRVAPERSTAEGVELLLRGVAGARLDWWLAYTYSRAEDRLDGRRVPRALDQPHSLALDLNCRLPRSWSLNFAWHYRSGWPSTPVAALLVSDPEDPEAEPELVAAFGPLNSRRFPDYHRLDLRASRRRDLRGGALTFYLDVQNLYNRHNLAGFDVAVDEEAGRVEMDEERWPGIFPSLGITWEF